MGPAQVIQVVPAVGLEMGLRQTPFLIKANQGAGVTKVVDLLWAQTAGIVEYLQKDGRVVENCLT